MKVGKVYFEPNPRFEILKKLGQGGYGIVWLALDQELGRQIAIKELIAQETTNPEFIERLRDEARAAARLKHPNIIEIYDVVLERDDTGACVLMEYLEGGSLRQRLHERGRLPVDEAVEIALGICRGLREAHEAGPIVHGDIKPDNVLFDRRGTPKLTDFGGYLPRQLGGHSYRPGGTPLYWSPEYVCGEERIGPGADLYAITVVLYEMLCGSFVSPNSEFQAERYYLCPESPVSGWTIFVYLAQSTTPRISPRQRNPEVPPGLEAIVMKGLATRPADRYQSAEELIAALSDWSGSRAPSVSLIDVTLPLGHEPEAGAEPTPGLEQALPDVLHHIRQTWVADPRFVWPDGMPYQALQEFYIGPLSSMREIQDRLPELTTEAQRAACDRLRYVHSRLFLDAFLYRVGQPRDLEEVVQSQMAAQGFLSSSGSVAELAGPVRRDWPLALLLIGDRAAATADWAKMQQGELDDATIAHHLAIAHYFSAQHLQAWSDRDETPTAEAVEAWRYALSNWAFVLENDDFWHRWVEGRQSVYRVPVTAKHLSDLRRQIERHLVDELIRHQNALTQRGATDAARQYDETRLLFEVELAGLRALSRLLRSSKVELSEPLPLGGPQMLHRLGRDDALAVAMSLHAYITGDILSLLTVSTELKQAFRDVRCYYSPLGPARAWLDIGRPERSLEALRLLVSAPDLELTNPAYRLLPDKRSLWERDRAELTLDAHFQSVGVALKCGVPDLKAIARHWEEAVAAATIVDDAEYATDLIRNQTLTQTASLSPDQKVALIEIAQRIIGPDAQLQAARTSLLKRRPETSDKEGVLPGADKQWRERVDELYAVLRVNPADDTARERLTRLIVEQIEEWVDEGLIEEARRTLAEWRDKLGEHEALEEQRRYLEYGCQIEDRLKQSKLKYTVNLLERCAFNLAFVQKRSAGVTVKLKIQGDIVRISAPLPEVGENAGEALRNLLRFTHTTPFYKVCREAGGVLSIAAEALAGLLTPEILGLLVGTVAYYVDVSPEALSLPVLESRRGGTIPYEGQTPPQPFVESDFERWQGVLLAQCRRAGAECTVAGDFKYRLDRLRGLLTPITAEFDAQGVRLETLLEGKPRPAVELYDRLARWNGLSRLGKAALNRDERVSLLCELTGLDEASLERALTALQRGASQCSSMLV